MGKNPSRWKGPRNSVEMLTWDEAVEFCSRATEQLRASKLIDPKQVVRLPSEAEWEYAARAGSQAVYPWGDDPHAGCAEGNGRDLTPWPDGGAWDARLECNDGHFSPAPVGSYAPNRFGLHEMIGNLSEWVQDCRHDSYDGAPADGSAWEQGGDCGSRLVRGGTFVYGPPGLRSANRTWSESSYRVWYQGFRVVEDR
jgi:formylglycine-generating enzyme required for sulfatase activity